MSDLLSSTELTNYAAAVQANLSSTITGVVQAHSLPDNVATGLKAQYDLMYDWLNDKTVSQHEILLTMLGKNSANNQMGIQIAAQHPWSRGTIFISSTSPFTQPKINPDYFGVGIDTEIMTYGHAFARKLGATSPLTDVMAAEAAPGSTVTSSALATYFMQNGGTEYHPLGTCSMLPKDSGGVVDTNLIVYGSANLRVIDASIMPLQISAHLMATTYGVAEKGADIIKQAHWAPVVQSSTSSSAAASTTATAGAATDTAVTTQNNQSHSESSLSTGAKIGIGVGAGAGVLALLAALIFFCCIRKKRDGKGEYAPPEVQDAYADPPHSKEVPREDMYPMAAFTAPLAPYNPTRSDSMDSMDTTNMASRTPMRSDSGYGFGQQMPYRDQSSHSLDMAVPPSRRHQGGGYPTQPQTYTPVNL